MKYEDVSRAVHEIHEFEFLTPIVPKQIPFEDALEKRQLLMEQNTRETEF